MSEAGLERLLKGALAALVLAGLSVAAYSVIAERALAPKRASPWQPMGKVPGFILTDQAGRPFDGASLKGKVWVASFIYTRCSTSCPLITSQMVHIQKKWGGHADFALVSISVDPGHDTPAVLAAYAKTMGAGLSDWSFLSGSPPDVFSLIQKGFLASVYPLPVRESGRSVDIPHTTDVRLMDRQGEMRGRFEGVLQSDWVRLDQAIGALLAE